MIFKNGVYTKIAMNPQMNKTAQVKKFRQEATDWVQVLKETGRQTLEGTLTGE